MSQPSDGNGHLLFERIRLLQADLESIGQLQATHIRFTTKRLGEITEILVLLNALIADTRRHLGLSETETDLASRHLADIKAALERARDSRDK